MRGGHAGSLLSRALQPYDADQDQSHINKLVEIGRLFEKIDLRYLDTYQRKTHPGSQRDAGRYILHRHGEKDDIPNPKNNITGKRRQYLEILAP